MTSVSNLGAVSIILEFELSRNIDGAARDVEAAINAARDYLPPNLPQNPYYRKVNPADAPILIIGVTSDTSTRGQLYDAASSILQQKLSQVDGVGQVVVGGAALPAVRAELNPTALNKYGIGLTDVSNMLASTSVNRPKGRLADGSRSWEINADDQLYRAEQYKPLIVAYRNGAPVRLSDVADVTDSVEDLRNAGSMNGKPSVLAILFRQPGANIVATVDRVRAVLPQLQADMPGGVTLSVPMDRTVTIRASLADVQRTVLISGALVILVVFAFLRNVRATLIPSIAVPVSLVSTFGVMYFFGYSLDNLSLMALSIATGFVVDDAIVVLENITRYHEKGLPPIEAALAGSREIGFTVLSISVSLVAVFIPLLLMGGLLGRLFREFAVTLSAAILASLVVSLTLTPMMCSRLLRHDVTSARGRLNRAGAAVFDGAHRLYERTLSWALRHPRTMITATVVTLGVNIYLYVIIPKGFFPQQDTGRLMGMIQASQDISFQSMRQKLGAIVDILMHDDAVESVTAFTGGSSQTNLARMFIALKPLEVRKISADQVIARVRRKLRSVPGAPTFLQTVQDVRVGGRMSASQWQYTLTGDNVTEVNAWAERLEERMHSLREVTDVSSDQQDKGMEASLVIDRDTASRLGITALDIDKTLYGAFGQDQVSVLYTSLNQYHMVMEVEPRFWQRPQSLQDIYVRSANGAEVPLSALSHYEPAHTALAIAHQGQFPAVTLSFNLPVGAPLGAAVDAIEAAALEMRMPATIHRSFQGTAKVFLASLANEPLLVGAALLAVYIVLGILYESYIHPITILSTLPSAGVGALLALKFFHTELSVIALIGIILLIGFVKKNGILIVDFALEAERKEGKPSAEAIYQACLLRFRPIMMLTVAALLAAVPLAIGTGVGSELRRPLGIAIIGGLIFSQALTLFTTPVIYLYMERLRLWLESLRHGPSPEAVRSSLEEPR